MKEEVTFQSNNGTIYKIVVILLIGLATVSGARKDLDQLLSFVQDVQTFADICFGGILPSAHARSLSGAERPLADCQIGGEIDEFRWAGAVEQGKAIEIKGISGDIEAEAAAGNQVEVSATKTSRASNPESVRIEIIQHSGGVTICAIYPSDDPDAMICRPGSGNGHSATIGVRNNDVNVDFKVRVPAGVTFVARNINGEINGRSLSGNVISHTVNGSISISTSGYAEAKTVNGEISATLGSANWSNTIEFKTINGAITLQLPATLSTGVTADTFNGEISSDFPLGLDSDVRRKHLRGTIGGGGRELVLKTLNGNINLKRST